MTEMKTLEHLPYLRVVRTDEEKNYQDEREANPFLISIKGTITHIETLETALSTQEKYIGSMFWRLIWFVFWLLLFFPMLILWHFMAEVRTRTLYRPARWFIRLENGEGFYLESAYQNVISFIEAEEQRLKFGFSMEKSATPITPDPIKDPWS